MNHLHKPIIAIAVAMVLSIASATTAFAADDSIMNGEIGFDYHIDGVDQWSARESGMSAIYQYGGATINLPVVTVSGTLIVTAPRQHLGTYKALVAASTNEYDVNGQSMGMPDYICDGPAWRWSESYDQLESAEGITREVPFSLSIPVPGYDEENEITKVYFVILLDCELHHPNYTTGYPSSNRTSFSCQLKGSLDIPEDMKPKPVVTLTTTNGGKLDPLRIKFRLMDNSSTPPKPLKDTIIRVQAPIPQKPASLIKDFFNTADWSLSGYFMSKTKCPNCEWKQAGSQYTSEIYYYLKNPGEPIEVLTDEQGQAELLFYLDLPALSKQYKTPTRKRTLDIPIKAEYIAAEGEHQGEKLAESSLNVNLNNLGYIVAVTYVQPQEWEPVGGLGDYRPAGYNPGEYDLASYVKDKGTGLPYDDVRGNDRATIAIQLSDTGGVDGYGVSGGTPALGASMHQPAESLQPGMLFAPGDKIDLDARGLVRFKPAAPQSPESGIKGKPGWVWIKLKFFDGLSAKVGVNGNAGQHSLTFGGTPYQSGWTTSGWNFSWWAGKEAAENVVSKFIPIYGQVDLVSDIAGYIKWFNGDVPIYIRVQSEFVITREEDGSSRLIVSEGHPVVVTEQTGFAGINVAVGESAVISPDNQISVSPATPEPAARAQELLAGLFSVENDPEGLKPIEVGWPSATGPTADTYEDEAGDVPIYGDEAGDVPLVEFEAGQVYSFDEFNMEVAGNWSYDPETEHSFASLSGEDIGLYIAIVRAEVSSTQLLQLMEVDYGEDLDLEVAGRGARICPLLEDGAEFGCMLSFEDPLSNGNSLHVTFIADSSYWADLSDVIVDIILAMNFSR